MTGTASLDTAHRQVVTSNGIHVDEGIRDLLEALWAHGMVTEFSCQNAHDELAYICFARAADAHRFVESLDEYHITLGEFRAWVDFPAHLIDGLAQYWVRRGSGS